jgi:hypothetical protein
VLPHEFPFRFLDRSAEGGALWVTLTANGAASRGSAYPQLLGVEILAQAASALLAPDGDVRQQQGRLAGIDGVRFHRPLRGSERLRAQAQLVRRYGRLVQVRVTLSNARHEPVVDGELLLLEIGPDPR